MIIIALAPIIQYFLSNVLADFMVNAAGSLDDRFCYPTAARSLVLRAGLWPAF